ncbi:MAG: U32 family peptidase [Lachnospiraceae bacterium]|nr:U32 family peptidase [Lachnospiraceae bacterium]
MEKPEILAPAGSMEALKAALSAGADAIYMGGSRFGARAYADNPDTDEMLEAIRYVHLRGKRLYLTVNTLVKEQEFGALYEFLAPYYSAGLDAAIVQDVGVLRFLAKEFPGLALHASTQMTLTAAEGVRLFDGYPVTRLVPARELSLPEIADICKKSGKEVEVFVHGALCYCYSGQCLMSSMIGGRSGNRGRCAQPCRMEYESEEKGKKYWLSPKDLCGLELLPELIRTGAASFKIEGRMKRPEYAAAVTAAYRKFTDLYFSLGEEGYRVYLREHPTLLAEQVQELADVYNRGGFTGGCFIAHNGKGIMSVNRPGHFGVPVGEVISGGKGEALIRLTKDVQPQDVLELRRETEKRSGEPGYYEYTLGTGAKAGEKIKAKLLPKLSAKQGDTVYRMRNSVLLDALEASYVKQELKVPVKGAFYAKSREMCKLEVSAMGECVLLPVAFPEQEKERVSVVCEGFVCEKAGKLPATEESVKKQLSKTGNEAFYFEELTVTLADDVFLPNGLLNELRRNALAMLTEAIQSRFVREEEKSRDETVNGDACDTAVTETVWSADRAEADSLLVSKQEPRLFGKPYLDCVVSTKVQAESVAKEPSVRRIYVDFVGRSPETVCEYADKLRQSGKEIWFCFPRICRKETSERYRNVFERLKQCFDGYLIRNYETLALIQEADAEWKSRCALDATVYVMNREAKAFYHELFGGDVTMTAPYELSEKELYCLGAEDMTLVVYGRIPLMVSAHCVKKTMGLCKNGKGTECGEDNEPLTLVDRVGKTLFVKQNCLECYNLIYNPECLSLLDGGDTVAKLKPRAIRLDFTFETGEETERILKCAAGAGGTVTGNGYTRGHLKRGVE